jgi:flagellar biosynthesis protein FliR
VSAALASVALASARLWACLRVQASWRQAIGTSWEWIAGAVAASVASVAWLGARLDVTSMAVDTLVIALGFELLLGSVLGLAISLPGWALVGAARESEAGLGVRGLEGEAASGSVARLLVTASLAAGLGLGLHAPLLAALLGTFERFPLARPSAWLPALVELPAWLIDQCAAFTVLALALATPVLLTRALVSLCVASLARRRGAAEALLAVLAPGLRLGAALVALGAAWAAYPEAFARGM